MRWQQIADAIDVNWCSDCAALHWGDTRAAHINGRAVRDDGTITIHWTNRRYTRGGAAKMLRLVAMTKLGYTNLDSWEQTYTLNRTVQELAKQARILLPRKLFEYDRSRLRFQMGYITIQERRTWDRDRQELYRKALRWAARS
jgi:hypothetical protein